MMSYLRNPVLRNELKIRMRGWRAVLAISIYIGILLFIAYIYFSATITGRDTMMGYGGNNPQMGVNGYMLLAIFQFFLIVFITPAQTSGAISGERERQTLDLLLCTKMRPLSIVLGKLVSSISFIVLMIIASIPLFSLIFLFGGISPGDLAMLFVFYLVTAIGAGSIGIFCSTLFKKTTVSTVVAYILVFLIGILTLMLGAYQLSMAAMKNPQTFQPFFPKILYLNPFIGLLFLLAEQGSAAYFIDGILGIGGLSRTFGSGGSGLSPWMVNCILVLTISIILLLISAVNINPVRKPFRFKRRSSSRVEGESSR
ncbi:MAG: ABC transporter permease [Clostridia bacterium]|jgi:ABC-2 type transport system permease protein